MAPRRRKKMMSLKGRVAVIASQAQWDQMQRKCANKYILVHFGAAWCVPCKKMKPIFSEFSRKNEYKMIVFAECNVDSLPDIATLAGVKTLPTFAVFHNGVAIETVSGGTPMKVVELLQKYSGLARHQGTDAGGGWKSLLAASLLATAAVAVGVLGYLWKTDQLPWGEQAAQDDSLSGGARNAGGSSKASGRGTNAGGPQQAGSRAPSTRYDVDSDDGYDVNGDEDSDDDDDTYDSDDDTSDDDE